MIVVVMGVSCAGKTTVGALLAESMGWRFVDGDDLHPSSNVEKMRQGIPLEDSDRDPWIDGLAGLIRGLERDGRTAILACSALRAAHRVRLRAAGDIRLVYLKGDFELFLPRFGQRTGHYMPQSLLTSQFATLEEPGDALTVDAGKEPEVIVGIIQHWLRGGDPCGSRPGCDRAGRERCAQ